MAKIHSDRSVKNRRSDRAGRFSVPVAILTEKLIFIVISLCSQLKPLQKS